MDRRSFLFALALGVATALVGADALAESTVRLRLLGTTDLHVNVLPYNYYADKEDVTVGLARTAGLIAKARADTRIKSIRSEKLAPDATRFDEPQT